MTQEEKITMTTVLVGDPSVTEEMISAYLTIAGQVILTRAYPYDDSVEEVPVKYHSLQCQIATYMINKRGAEGELTHSENAITRQYASASIPPVMLSEITPFCGTLKLTNETEVSEG